MNQDYSHLYGPPANAAPPQPFVLNGAEETHSSPVPDQPPKPAVFRSSDMQQMPMPQPYQQPRPVKPKQPFSPTSFLLIAGVLFLFLGGVIFLTQTWATLPDTARAVVLLSVSVMFFGANIVAEKGFRLPKTGLAFYILGCIFLPMAVAGIGVFRLWGEWFSFRGGGSDLVSAVTFLCVAVSTGIGVHSYKSRVLAWLSLFAGAGTMFFLGLFIAARFEGELPVKENIFCLWYLLFCAGVFVWAEWEQRRDTVTIFGSASKWFSYILMLMTMLTFGSVILSPNGALLMPLVGSLVLCAGFFSPRFEKQDAHAGAFGITGCLLNALYALTKLSLFRETDDIVKALFAATAAAVVLMSFRSIPLLSERLQKTASVLGIVLMLPLGLVSGVGELFTKGQTGYLFLLYSLGFVSLLLFCLEKKNPFAKDTIFCVMSTAAVWLMTLVGANKSNIYLIAPLLMFTALVLLMQGFLTRRIWCFVTAGSAVCGMVLLNTEKPFGLMLYLCAAFMLIGVIYSHICKRFLLEKAFALCFIPTFLTGLFYALKEAAELKITLCFVLFFTAVTLLYLLEAAAFPSHRRTQGWQGTRFYLELLSTVTSIAALICYLLDSDIPDGFGFLLLLLTGVYAVSFLRMKINLAAALPLIELFITAHHLISRITKMQVTAWGLPLPGSMTPENMADLLKVTAFIILLGVFALTGRLLLPKFYEGGNGILHLDLPLLTGVLCIFSAAAEIRWYPSILVCLFLTLYSLLFIGRLQNRRIPALLASVSGCLTLLLHNIHDPFLLLDKLSVLDIKTLRIMLYLLPFHIFILTLLLILPKAYNKHIHVARFVMYSITMATLLIASLRFRNVTDAIVLVGFSFLILAGSFVSKKLRWFTLGFAVMVIMTIHLTWSFWRSLHWGIYLFLAGILLIVIASLYEYSARYAKEHPDEPKKKRNLFASWQW
ncbi:MAG: hypothetical protein K6F80_00810 [Oscillospiraceae bacterium]|nr:hypothetical protein [Oscillospiraceae bacterium]